MAVDLSRAEARARRAYEIARLQRAATSASPLLLLAPLAALLGGAPLRALALCVLVLGAAVVALWRGGSLGRAVMPGVLAGLLPLGVGLAMRWHGCESGCCSSVCIPMCVGAGAIAGGYVASVGLSGRMPAAFWLSAATMTLLTGALGCACVGAGGLIGLAAGVAVPVVAGALRMVLAEVRT